MTHTPLAQDEIAELERLCAAATGGPASAYLYLGHTARTALPRLLAEVKQLRTAITDCERATWHEGITPSRLATRIRRIAQKTLPVPPHEEG